MQFRKPIFALLACLLVFPAGACNLGDILTKGSTSRSVALDIIKDSTVGATAGEPLNTVVFNSSGIDLWYRREGAARTAITEATLAALTTAWSTGGFLYISDGAYRLDVPDAAFATSANYVDVGGAVTGGVIICQRVRLVDYSLEDAVRGTVGTALPNAVAGASTGVLVNGSNSGTVTLAAFTVAGATTHTGTMTLADGLVVARSTSNQPAATFTGNGTGNGVTVTSGAGATGTGLAVVSGATNGAGATFTGTGTGNGATFTSGSGATGNGINATSASTNGNGFSTAGSGTGAGHISTGGTTGHGLRLVGGATSGNGISTSFTAPSSCSAELGSGVCGTLSGTHSSTTADLGTNAPGTISDLPGATVYFPTRNVSRAISSYDTSTGIATWLTTLDADITLTNGDPWILFSTSPGTGGSGLDAPGVRAALGFASANFDTQIAGAQSDLDNIQTRVPAALSGGRMDASVGAYQSGLAPLQPATSGRTLVVDAAGLADANAVKVGPTGSGTPQTARDLGASVLLSSGTGAGQLSLSSGAVLLQATQAGVTIPTVTNLTNAPTAGDFTATMKASIGTAVAASPVASVTGNVNGSVATANALGPNAITAAATAPDFATEINTGMATQANVDTAVAQTTAAAIRAAIGLGAANADTQFAGIPAAVGSYQIPDSYSADGAQPTRDQALLELHQIMIEATLSGNQLLIKKPDGTTTAITITLSPSAANPVSRTRTP